MRFPPDLNTKALRFLTENGFEDVIDCPSLISELLHICYISVPGGLRSYMKPVTGARQYTQPRYQWVHLSKLRVRSAYITAEALLVLSQGGTDFYLTDEEEDLILQVLSPE